MDLFRKVIWGGVKLGGGAQSSPAEEGNNPPISLIGGGGRGKGLKTLNLGVERKKINPNHYQQL